MSPQYLRKVLSLGFLIALSAPIAVAADAEQTAERVRAGYLLAVGRLPVATEIGEWNTIENVTVAKVVAAVRERLASGPSAAKQVAAQAHRDALGIAATDATLKSDAATGGIYFERMQRHLESLAAHPDAYAQVLNRAYQFVVRRDVYPEEIEYWRSRDTLPYLLLVGCLEDWARRNQPGLMITNGQPTVSVNSQYLVTARLSPAVATEARAAVGLAPAEPPPTDALENSAKGRNIIAAGARDVISAGRIHFAVAGGSEPGAATAK